MSAKSHVIFEWKVKKLLRSFSFLCEINKQNLVSFMVRKYNSQFM